MFSQIVSLTDILVITIYLLLVAYLGWLGYSRTKNASDYLVAGRKTHAFIRAMSYGATFISTSAIEGFGGVAGMFGMSLLWLTFLNIFVGIFIAFIFLGGPTRRMGHILNAHTFPELMGKRFDSRFIQVFAGLIIFLFIPIYSAAVIIGGTEFITAKFGINYNLALLIFSLIVAAYVIAGGLKAVMYTDTLQGVIMFVGMAMLLVWAYQSIGGVVAGHHDLTAMKSAVFAGHKAIGHNGWTATPTFGFGDGKYDLWWIVFTTIVMGVGIGVLAQPQLVVRFMTVKSKRELNRAVLVGGIFILAMTGVAFTVGAVSNAYFYKHETVKGHLIATSDNALVIAKKNRIEEKAVPCKLLHIDTNGTGEADTHIVAEGVGKAAAIMPKAEIVVQRQEDDGSTYVEVKPHSSAFTRAVVYDANTKRYMFNPDSIIPAFITSAMPAWFSVLFLVTLLAAAMSTISSQFHTLGAAIGHDVYSTLARKPSSIGITRLGIILGLVLSVTIGMYCRGDYFIARATAIFFGLCASTFLPAFIGGLFIKRMTKPAVIASMIAGFVVTAFWVLFVKSAEADAIGLVYKFTGGKSSSILASHPNWPSVDPLVIALPLSILVAIVVSMITRPPKPEHVAKCFNSADGA